MIWENPKERFVSFIQNYIEIKKAHAYDKMFAIRLMTLNAI